MARKRTQAPYFQRCLKICAAETAAEAEALVNGLFEEAALSGGDLPEVQVIPTESGRFTIIIYSYLKVE